MLTGITIVAIMMACIALGLAWLYGDEVGKHKITRDDRDGWVKSCEDLKAQESDSWHKLKSCETRRAELLRDLETERKQLQQSQATVSGLKTRIDEKDSEIDRLQTALLAAAKESNKKTTAINEAFRALNNAK